MDDNAAGTLGSGTPILFYIEKKKKKTNWKQYGRSFFKLSPITATLETLRVLHRKFTSNDQCDQGNRKKNLSDSSVSREKSQEGLG